jgi:shikimate kinase
VAGDGADTIWIVGMMGAGKSAVGRLLAARLGRPFIDTDAEIEQAAGASVRELFEREGEAGFRTRERAAVAAVAGQKLVVALGGGAIAQAGMPERLAATGAVVYLKARPETLLQRIGDAEERPLLRGLGPDGRRARMEQLLHARAPAYATARVVIETDGLDADEVAAAVARAL